MVWQAVCTGTFKSIRNTRGAALQSRPQDQFIHTNTLGDVPVTQLGPHKIQENQKSQKGHRDRQTKLSRHNCRPVNPKTCLVAIDLLCY